MSAVTMKFTAFSSFSGMEVGTETDAEKQGVALLGCLLKKV